VLDVHASGWTIGALGFALVLGCGRIGFDHFRDDGGDGSGTEGGLFPDANRAFTSSIRTTGALGGVAGGDAICQAAADAAGLTGTFVSLLATSTSPHDARLTGSRGWIDLHGNPIADQPSDWWGGRMLNPLGVDERGQPYTFSMLSGDAAAQRTCLDWTTAEPTELAGVVNPDTMFTEGGANHCGRSYQLPCAEIGRTVEVRPMRHAGRDAFVTATAWLPGGGRATADAQCASEAAAASLPGSYLALLGTTTTAASARLSTAGLPWRRTDGVLLAPTAAETFASATRSSFLHLTAAGEPTGPVTVWRGHAIDNCDDWTSASAAAVGQTAVPSSTGYAFDFFGQLECDQARRIVCLQE
jgi:hypothetical protein